MLKRFFKIVFIIALLFAATNSIAKDNEWKEYKKLHFIIYYKSAPLDFVETVEAAAEEYYTGITRDMGFTRYKSWTWDKRAKIFIYDDSDDYVNSGKMAGWSHGVASILERTIRTFPAAHGFFDSTLPHELGHIIFREFVGFDVSIPLWFEEGIAMQQEKAKRWGSDKAVKKAIKNDLFMTVEDLKFFRPRKKSDLDKIHLFYSESASLVSYLRNQHGEHRFTRFLREIKQKKSFYRAFESVYSRFKNMERLNKNWVKYLSE